ncbi:MAG: PucR family transcriptional regulator, partial [Oscillospiraceae bacterium]
MSSRIFQSVIVQMKEATDRCIGVIDSDGFVVACSELSSIGTKLENLQGISTELLDQFFVAGTRTFKVLGSLNSRFDYAVFVEGRDSTARCVCIMAAVAFNEAKTNYDEKYNKATFVKNIISDNILPGDVYVRAKELNFVADVPRAVILIRQTDKSDIAAFELIQG